MKKSIFIDVITLSAVILFLFLEGSIFGRHTIPGLCGDIGLFGYFIYRLIRNDLTIPAYLFPALSLFGIIKYLAGIYFPSYITDVHIIVGLGIMGIIAAGNLIITQPQKKIVRTYGNPPAEKDIPPYSIFITPDTILPRAPEIASYADNRLDRRR